jgi:hypothetical protein
MGKNKIKNESYVKTNSLLQFGNGFNCIGTTRYYSLTTMVAYLRPLFNKLRHCLITFPFFVRCQRLIARNVANGFLLNRGVSHCYETCCIDDVSRGSLSGYKSI